MTLFLATSAAVFGVALGSRLVVKAAQRAGLRGLSGRPSSDLLSTLWRRGATSGEAQRLRNFYRGGFEPEMTRAEAALILGIRYISHPTSSPISNSEMCPKSGGCVVSRQSSSKEKVRLAHRRIMLANHPDNGGSDYMASKVNEAKDTMLKDLAD